MKKVSNLSDKTLKIIAGCLFGVAIILFLVVIVVLIINMNKTGNENNNGNEPNNGNGSSVIEDNYGEGKTGAVQLPEEMKEKANRGYDNPEEESKQIERAKEKNLIIEELKELSDEEAFSYLDSRISGTEDANDRFIFQSLKVNIHYNGQKYNEALSEMEKIDVSQLNIWNQRDYYAKMNHIYNKLGNTEKEAEYYNLWQQKFEEIGGEAIVIQGE